MYIYIYIIYAFYIYIYIYIKSYIKGHFITKNSFVIKITFNKVFSRVCIIESDATKLKQYLLCQYFFEIVEKKMRNSNEVS